ncbi:hypothetical protein [Nocardioides sp. Iso805N]|uniref:hypothetical protein n=1 Tax=Nocardioides sp. Iso805N TaxID=1283287 RepID=UPI0003A55FA6|nr:hypothetical protein [Nocardioides sp. Iso805N]
MNAPAAKTVKTPISGNPTPNPMMDAPPIHTAKNNTIPKTGWGSRQIMTPVSHVVRQA